MKSTTLHNGAKILVIDDASFEQFALRDILGSRGYRVSSATDGRQGYEVALLTQPALIVLDFLMDGMDGFATCRLLKANPATASIPVIFLSGADSEGERIEGLTLGAVDFVGKPFSAGELLARIAIHLRLARPAGAAATATATATTAPTPDTAAHASAGADDILVKAVRQLIDGNLAEPFKLDELARRIGSYREKLSRIFLERHGMTVFAYIRERRIAAAAAMLHDTDAGIAEIAMAVGFSNAGNFATAFREKTGMTPGAYRRRERRARSAVAAP